MFTLAEVKQARVAMKNNANFVAYIKDIFNLGVVSYNTYVTDGHTDYLGKDKYGVATEPNHDFLKINNTSDISRLTRLLKLYNGKMENSIEFFRNCADAGVKKWTVNTVAMTCTYFDKAGIAMLVEIISGG
jgi:uncharacterized protein YbcV (DUF1398 family)